MKTSLVKSLAFLLLATSAYSPLKAMNESEDFTAHITATTPVPTSAEEETAGENVVVSLQAGAGAETDKDPDLLAVHTRIKEEHTRIEEEFREVHARIDEELQVRHARIEEEFRAVHARIDEELQVRRTRIEEEFLAESTGIEEESLTKATQSRSDTGAGAGVVDETATDAELFAQRAEVEVELAQLQLAEAESEQLGEAIYLAGLAQIKAESAAKQRRLEAEDDAEKAHAKAEDEAGKAHAKAEDDAAEARTKARFSEISAKSDAEGVWLKTESEKHNTAMVRLDGELARLAEEEARSQAENLAELARIEAESLARMERINAELAQVRGAGAGVEVPEQKGGSTTVLAPTTAPAVQGPPAKKSSSS